MPRAPHLPVDLRLRRRRRESGSAYVVALLVLVLLTIFGLSLALITQTEAQIGAAEKATTRMFYAADSGLAIAVARLLTTSDPVSKILHLNATGSGTLQLVDEVEVSPVFPIADAPCNLCSINQHMGEEWKQINHVLTANARRSATQGTEQRDLAAKQLSLMFEVQPMSANILALRQLYEGSTDEQARLKRLIRY